jgi:transglutaminase-like putative cysteine protease
MQRLLRLTVIAGVVWLVATGLAVAAPVTPPFDDLEDWAGTYFKGKKLGFSHSKVRKSANHFDVHTLTYMHLDLGGQAQITSFTQETKLNSNLGLSSFSLVQEISGNRQKVEGRVEGGVLILTLTSPGYSKEKRLPFAPDVLPSATYLLNILKDGLEVGVKKQLPLFVEPFQSFVPLEYEIVRREKTLFAGTMVEAFVIVQKVGGIASTLWVADSGQVIREVSTQGFESHNEPEAEARALPDGAISVGSFITLSRVKPQHPIRRPDAVRQLKLRIMPISSPNAIPQDRRQRALKVEKLGEEAYSTVLEIRSEPQDPKAKALLPISGGEAREYLQDAQEIQSEHPQIRALARELAKGEKDAWIVARRINEWVFKNIKKEMVDTATALDTLRERRGECQSHTNLFTAVARAAGIPTRIVNGLVYSEELDGFGFHAWPEVFVGEWRALDPTLGQTAVDATHIKLSQGDQTMQFKVMEFVGKIGIEVIEK